MLLMNRLRRSLSLGKRATRANRIQGVEVRRTAIIEKVSVERTRSGFGHSIDGTSRGLANLRPKAAGGDLEFSDRIRAIGIAIVGRAARCGIKSIVVISA